MASLDRNLRRDLENAVKKARRVAEAGARAALVALRVGEGRVPTGPEAALRKRLRAHGRQLGDTLDERKETQSIERLKDECAYQHWHRLLFARFLAENDLLIEPDSGMALSLDECRELAREQSKDWLVLASEFAQRMLPQIFRAGDPALEVALPPERRQELEAILEGLPRKVFIADDSLGWVYQFWQADQKDAVNASEIKIGANELPAVTQLFTEDYMVLFLLHNTLGAWWAGKVLAAKSDIARSAASEDECRAACAVQGIEWSFLRFEREHDVWLPVAGTFPGWPTAAKDLTVLDPSMGSGHFLAFALPMLVALRQAEEQLSIAEAVDAVLRDNLFGLELDPRCTQIAAFNVGLTAWKLAAHRPLPALNLACAGLGINAPLTAWTALAAGDPLAENAMTQLYELFRQAPTLGSLIDPTRVGGELFVANFDKIRGLLSSALATERSEDAELAVVAQGIAKAASILAHRYTLVATNVPYLGRPDQVSELRDYCDRTYPDAKADLSTCFLSRCLSASSRCGTVALVTPQSWLFQPAYKRLRHRLLGEVEWNLVARLGARAFETISGERVNVCLLALSATPPARGATLGGVDVSGEPTAFDKAEGLRRADVIRGPQAKQREHPDFRIMLESSESQALLHLHASCIQGLATSDDPQFILCFWELQAVSAGWEGLMGTVEKTVPFAGRERLIHWQNGTGRYYKHAQALKAEGRLGGWKSGTEARGRIGVLISQMSSMPVTIYTGEFYDHNASVLICNDLSTLPAIWVFASSPEFALEVRKLDTSLKPSNNVFVKVPFDVDRWRTAAATAYPTGLPKPFSSDPTQWIFAGHPANSLAPLQVTVARLLGYRWPRQSGSSFMDCPAVASDGLESQVDGDGIVCLPSLRGEASAAERTRALLADAFGADWSVQKLNELLAEVGAASLDDWLRNNFFSQHCDLFDNRPFVWQVWDGLPNGFSALMNYHQLAAPNGEGRRVLDKLTHTYLGDWLDRQRADQKAGVEGADGRVAAAVHLKAELERILEGEPPYDLFVRWKPLHQQPVGWEPDIDDGVRMNIRPFMTAKPWNARGKNACILRAAPKVKWDKDRGKEPTREKAEFPWFWGWDESAQDFVGGNEFDGNRWNNLHYGRAAKLAARAGIKGGRR